MLVDLPTDIKQKYAFKKKRNKPFEGTKKQQEKQNKTSIILLYFTQFLSKYRSREIVKNHISCDNVRSLSHPTGECPQMHLRLTV